MGIAQPKKRSEIAESHKWNLTDIFEEWDAWEAAYSQLATLIDRYAGFKGTLGQGAEPLLRVLRASDELGQLAYKVWYYAALRHDEDQRDNAVNARRQRVQTLLARWKEAAAWFNPEVLQIPLSTVQSWFAESEELAVYRFAVEDLFRQQEHVLDDRGERLLSLSSQFTGAPQDSYAALSTADMKFPTITLSSGDTTSVSYGTYRAILATNRVQEDRSKAFHAYLGVYASNANTYAALYHSVLERDWFLSRARAYTSTLEAALHTNNIPVSVVENLIDTTRNGVEPLRRYHRLRHKILGVPEYHTYDGLVPLVEFDRRYPYDQVLNWIVESVAPLGEAYQERMRQGFSGRWIDVFESEGKRSGAYSAPVYGVHPYMLLNYNETLDAVFTLAHEMGHSMHTLLTHARQPFVYSDYTIFVAEVPSTLSEALLLGYMLERSDDPLERAVLLQHAIDGIVSTFYTQVMFADFELQAHRLVEKGEPITTDTLAEVYVSLTKAYYGDVMTHDDLLGMTWARIPHFFHSPYYVYQYATCFASSARLIEGITASDATAREAALDRYLRLLEAGGSDHPMSLLRAAGVDLSSPDAVQAVTRQLDTLVNELEGVLNGLALPEPMTALQRN